ncbi:hypothetical protein [Rubrivivax gelatinosus]|uniref:hypothetical protein n=1 Tax=Rubrivivax gelatinosus TaxID=28068 RepID=UPI0002D79E28|nr:hypothetical protein [Rubrivivax gelatinosus]MBG6080047.1 hypothetical protein [Rubrivivax gelatinosus]
MFSKPEPTGLIGPTTSFAPSGLGELPLAEPPPRRADGAERRHLLLIEGAAITALIAALALELGVALGLY